MNDVVPLADGDTTESAVMDQDAKNQMIDAEIDDDPEWLKTSA